MAHHGPSRTVFHEGSGRAPGDTDAWTCSGRWPRTASASSRGRLAALPVRPESGTTHGTLEPGFRRSTRQWAERLRWAGLPCRHEEWTGGHEQVWWQQRLPVALGWLLRA
jgi:enterochelin esterase-like enzyme